MNLAFLWKAASSSFLFPVAVAYAGIKVLDATFFRKNTAPLALHEKEGTDEGDVLKNEKEESVIWISVLLFKFWSQWATNLEDEILKLIYPMVVEARPQIFPYLAVSDISIGTEPPYVVSVKTFSNPDPRTLIVDCLLEWISPDNQITLRTGLTHGPRVMKASNLSIKARTRFVLTLSEDTINLEKMSISIVGRPVVKLSVVPFASGIDLLGGNKIVEWFNDLVYFLLSELITFPNAVSITLTTNDGTQSNELNGERSRTKSFLSNIVNSFKAQAEMISHTYFQLELIRAVGGIMDSRPRQSHLNFDARVQKEMRKESEDASPGFISAKVIEAIDLGGQQMSQNFHPIIRLRVGEESRDTEYDLDGHDADTGRDVIFNERLYVPVSKNERFLCVQLLAGHGNAVEDLVFGEKVVGSAWISIEEIQEAAKVPVWVHLKGTCSGEADEGVGMVRMQMAFVNFARQDEDQKRRSVADRVKKVTNRVRSDKHGADPEHSFETSGQTAQNRKHRRVLGRKHDPERGEQMPEDQPGRHEPKSPRSEEPLSENSDHSHRKVLRGLSGHSGDHRRPSLHRHNSEKDESSPESSKHRLRRHSERFRRHSRNLHKGSQQDSEGKGGLESAKEQTYESTDEPGGKFASDEYVGSSEELDTLSLNQAHAMEGRASEGTFKAPERAVPSQQPDNDAVPAMEASSEAVQDTLVQGEWVVDLLESTQWPSEHNFQCEIVCGPTTRVTKVQKDTQQPVWDEHFTFPVNDPSTDLLNILVLGKELLASDLILGRALLQLRRGQSMRMRELWIPLIMDKHDEKPVWARCWVGYRCLTPATSLGPSSFLINPINQLLTDRVQRMKHNFRQRNEDAEKAENIQLLQAIRKLSTEVFDTIQKNAMEIRLGHEALVEKIRHGNDASTSRGLALYSVESSPEKIKEQHDCPKEKHCPVLISVETSDHMGSGTDGEVWLTFHGVDGGSSPVMFLNRRKHSFSAGSVDVFCILIESKLAPIKSMTIGHYNSGLSLVSPKVCSFHVHV
uniref:C2 domain-containing protein n=2 Tax=Rhodosorus marinus TaxID=101924 RepID=A0A7S2ZH40_9RHOD|mmetsp:Transcript_18835/g.75565  ORF Transcript_18835/g.75565 Transcript_18835/m.75565 type:complete len:1022 (+) Transcript_18835:420-3485(+)